MAEELGLQSVLRPRGRPTNDGVRPFLRKKGPDPFQRVVAGELRGRVGKASGQNTNGSSAASGFSRMIFSKSSFEIRSVSSLLTAVAVAVRGTSPKMAISPMMSFRPTVFTTMGPDGVGNADLDLAFDDDIGGVAHVARLEHDLSGRRMSVARR